MARIRTIKPEMPSDQRLARCSLSARWTFVSLITQADDYGLIPAAPRQLLGTLFPNDDDITIEHVGGWLAELHSAGLIEWRWRRDGGPVIQLAGWEKHQRIDNRRRPVLLTELDEERRDSPPFAEIRREPPRTAARTSDLRPPTMDLGSPTSGFAVTEVHEPDPAPRRGAPKKPNPEQKHPHFTEPYRTQVFEAWRTLGTVNGGRLVNAIGPCFLAPDAPGYVPPEYVVMGVVDYCGLILKGKSSAFVGPEDCGKRLLALARNCQRLDPVDPVARMDANFVAIHGHRMAGSGAA